MTAQACIDQIRKAAPFWTDNDIDLIVSEFQKKRQRMKLDPSIDGAEAEFMKYARQVGEEIVWAARMQKKHQLLNIKVKRNIRNLVDQADAVTGDPSLGFTAANVGINTPLQGGRLSVDARSNALAGQYMGGLIADLREQDLLAAYNLKDNEPFIQKELWELSRRERGKPGVTKNAEALQIAKIIYKYQRFSVDRLNRAGAGIGAVDGFITSHAHDRVKMRRAGKEQWIDDILPGLDLDRTYPDAEDIRKALSSAYDVLVSGRSLNQVRAEPGTVKFSGPANRAKKLSQHRTLHFKDADAEMAYNKKYSAMGFKEAVASSMERAARETALMEMWGPNPRAMFDNMLSETKDKYRGDLEKLDKLNRGGNILALRSSLDAQFRTVDGSIYTEGTPSVAAFTSSVRAIISMAKLGGAVLSAVSDVPLKASQLRFQGRSFLDSYGQALKTFVDGVAPGDRRRVAELIGVGLDGQIGDLAARFSAQDGIPGTMAKMQRIFFKLNLLTPWTDANSRGFGMLMARDLAMDKALGWAEMPERRRMILSQYGIGETEWNVGKAAIRKMGADGDEYLMPDAFTSGDEAVNAAIQAAYPGRSVTRVADELETKFRAFYADQTRAAVPMPGAAETAILTQGASSGTWGGEAMRFMTQFKAFPTFMLNRVIGQRLSGTGGGADMLGLVELILATTVMGYVAQSAKELSKGRNVRDPADPKTMVAAMLQGGGLGIYGDFFFGEFNRFGGGFWSTALGPAAAGVEDLLKIKSDVMDAAYGDKEWTPALNNSLRFLINNTPGVNLFYTRAVLDYMLLYPMYEHINPGYLRRYERRIEKENSQTFWLPPTEAAR